MNEVIVNKSFDFAVRIVKLNKYLISEKGEYLLSKQIGKSGTSIGANVTEAQQAQSAADFLSKMSIALKESKETEYWLKLLYKTDYIDVVQYDSMNSDLSEIIKILVAICKTTRDKINN